MSEHSFSADLSREIPFELERRGYSRSQVDEAVAQLRLSNRDLEDQLSQAIDEAERLKLELRAARSGARSPHQEISERIGQILKLADDEAKALRLKAEDEIANLRAEVLAETSKLRADTQAETDRSRVTAQDQAERMLTAAQQQAEETVAAAQAEADSTRKSAATEAERVVSEATRNAEMTLAAANTQAKQQLDEATARAAAIHDGAERRLGLLMSRHTETLRRMTEIRDVVASLVATENDRGPLEDEVARIVAGAFSGDGRSGNGQAALSTAKRPGMAGSIGPPSALGGRPEPESAPDSIAID
ncbi:MAG: hypothetical protein J2P27_10885 [Actinobacteria bacterium]|nr:hypothetical protein [Actinomycetota bacterium]